MTTLDASAPPWPRSAPLYGTFGATLFGAGVACVLGTLLTHAAVPRLPAFAAGAACILLGALVAAPAYAGPALRALTSPLARWAPRMGALTRARLSWLPCRPALAAGALMTGMALAGGAAVLAASARASVPPTAPGAAPAGPVDPVAMQWASDRLFAASLAVTGIATLIMLARSVAERRGEAMPRQSHRAGRRDARRAVLLEALLTTFFGASAGLVIGAGLGSLLPGVLAEEGLTDLAVPWGRLGAMLVLACLAALAAAAWPASRADRISPGSVRRIPGPRKGRRFASRAAGGIGVSQTVPSRPAVPACATPAPRRARGPS
jgi:hypothetical protein